MPGLTAGNHARVAARELTVTRRWDRAFLGGPWVVPQAQGAVGLTISLPVGYEPSELSGAYLDFLDVGSGGVRNQRRV